jgi:predicted molibdopterin-dependent oxidoreductase YjgC
VNNGLIGVWQRANDQGAWDMGFRPVVYLQSAMQSAKAMLVAGADPAGDFPELAETSQFLVVQDLFLTATARLADVFYPLRLLPNGKAAIPRRKKSPAFKPGNTPIG